MSDSGRPSTNTIVGVGLLLFGVPLAIVGLGHLIRNGSCSTSGFDSDTGARLPFCPRGEVFWFLFLFGGICVAVLSGFVLARRSRIVTQVRAATRLVPLARQWSAAAAAAPPPQPADVGEQLDRLTALHAQGALTDEELATAKARLLM